ncbi:P-loop containing nucleoside triphosphate hydrolase protein [Cystobasidium minutum MCA 4210]|uniref:P-loop containing nucleoside triphosphate hydrolase protein n=1 Tax=Cystobasidium minutum MCA 4210 TaxID=1397322 RepID=UPI0034CF9A17|eukprot:jgi/Rhomi1/14667/CE14666_232
MPTELPSAPVLSDDERALRGDRAEDEERRIIEGERAEEQCMKREDLPAHWRPFWRYSRLNKLQTAMFDPVANHRQSMVVQAPAGAGKTGVQLMGVLANFDDGGNTLYLSSTRAILQERQDDWSTVFGEAKCKLVLGHDNNIAISMAMQARIVLTTPEKLLSMTALCSKASFHQWLSQFSLIILDEIHLIGDASRGPALECAFARMSMLGGLARVMAFSATIPNIEDIKKWIEEATESQDCGVYKYGDDFREVPLKTGVIAQSWEGMRSNRERAKQALKDELDEEEVQSTRQRDMIMDTCLSYQVFDLVVSNNQQKPSLVFCNTIKGTIRTAAAMYERATQWADALDAKAKTRGGLESMLKELEGARMPQNLGAANLDPWPIPPLDKFESFISFVDDVDLRKYLKYGIAFHHSELSEKDRKIVLTMFRHNGIGAICCTSTLAYGVNLPARYVLVKYPRVYRADGSIDKLEAPQLMQMLGRAGRPGLDTEGLSHFLVGEEEKDFYEQLKLEDPQWYLESGVHHVLLYTLIAEIRSGFGCWESQLRRFFSKLYYCQRLRDNPQAYPRIPGFYSQGGPLLDQAIERLRVQGLIRTKEHLLQDGSSDKSLMITPPGDCAFQLSQFDGKAFQSAVELRKDWLDFRGRTRHEATASSKNTKSFL